MIVLTKAITAREIVNSNANAAFEAELERIEESILDTITEARSYFTIYGLSVRAQEALRDAGYTINKSPDQRDGDLYMISF